MFNVVETFRPSYGKTSLTVVLFLLFAPVLNVDTGVRCITAPCPSGKTASIAFALISGDPILVLDPFNSVFWLAISYVFSASAFSFLSIIREKRLIGRT